MEGENKQKEQQPAQPELPQQQEIQLDTDFMKDLIKDMNLDIDPNQMQDLMDNALGKKKEDENEKKDEDKK